MNKQQQLLDKKKGRGAGGSGGMFGRRAQTAEYAPAQRLPSCRGTFASDALATADLEGGLSKSLVMTIMTPVRRPRPPPDPGPPPNARTRL